MRLELTGDGPATPAHGVTGRTALRSVGQRVLCSAGLVLLASLLLGTGVAEAKKPFEIRTASSRLADGVWFASADIDYRLSDDALEALQNGVALTIQLQIEVTRVRRFWTDAQVASLQQAYLLRYQPLSERYVVRNLNSGDHKSFATLFSALNDMGRIVDLPIIDASVLSDARYEISMRAVLDQNTLPGPLRLLAFWGEGFRLVSDWYTWTLDG